MATKTAALTEQELDALIEQWIVADPYVSGRHNAVFRGGRTHLWSVLATLEGSGGNISEAADAQVFQTMQSSRRSNIRNGIDSCLTLPDSSETRSGTVDATSVVCRRGPAQGPRATADRYRSLGCLHAPTRTQRQQRSLAIGFCRPRTSCFHHVQLQTLRDAARSLDLVVVRMGCRAASSTPRNSCNSEWQ